MTRFLAFFVLFFVFLSLFGCADKYQSYRSLYKFRSQDGTPDYTNLDYWAAHPWKKDPSDSVPLPLRFVSSDSFSRSIGLTHPESATHSHNLLPQDSVADVFFVHPTTFTRKRDFTRSNAAIDDDYINAKTDYSTILLQASAFNENSRVFAPRYRQAHIGNFYSADSASSSKALAVAYQDVRNAFIYYLEHFNDGRPIVIASHSQGALLSIRLLKEFFEGKPLQSKLVVAYVVGWPLNTTTFNKIPACTEPNQTGCLCSWRTFKEGYLPVWVKKEIKRGDKMVVTNPLSWTVSSAVVPKSQNKGAILMDFNRVYPKAASARIDQGVVFTAKPKFPGSFLYHTRNYHIGDINLYYLSIRDNLKTRLSNFH